MTPNASLDERGLRSRSNTTDFRFIELNPRRAARGVESARVAVIEDGDEQWLWMSKRDIAKNMVVFGKHPELVKAHEAYGAQRLVQAAPR